MRNPYEPPKIENEVGAPDQPESSPEPPRSVKIAVTCLVTCTVFAALITLGQWLGLRHSSAGGRQVQNVLSILFLAFVTWKIGTRRRWALWLAAAVYLCGLGIALAAFLQAPALVWRILAASPLYLLASGLVQLVLQGVALALLFGADARQWFRTRGL
jgi:hypothetical protein